MALNGPKFLLAIICGFFILQQTECAPGHGKNKKNCDLPVLLSQLRNEVHQEQRQTIYPPNQQHIPELLSDISDILMQSNNQGDVIASNLGSGVNNVQDSVINVAKNGYGGGGDFIASNAGSGVNNVENSQINVMHGAGYAQQPQYGYASSIQGDVTASNMGSGVNNVEGSAINVMKSPSMYGYAQQYQGDVIASNMGSGVNNVKDSQINVAKNGGGDFIASNSGSGVNNVEGSEINVMKNQYGYAPQAQYQEYQDVIASNMGSGVNNVMDSKINVVNEGYGGGGDFIASNSGSGVNNVEGSSINVMKSPSGYGYAQQYQGDVIASNTGSGVNNVKDTQINVAKNGYGGGGDFIASNSGSGVNNVEGSAINVMSTYAPQYGYSQQYQGDVIASNMGSGVNNVVDTNINVANEGYGGGGNFIASNSGSGVNNVEGSSINVMKGPSGYGYAQQYQGDVIASNMGSGVNNVEGTEINVMKGPSTYAPQYAHSTYQGDVIASNMGSGVNNVKDSQINVAKNGYGGGGDFIASNAGSGVNNVEGSSINVMKQQPKYSATTYAPQMISRSTQYQGDVIASNMGSGVNSVKDSQINVAKNGYSGGNYYRPTTYAPQYSSQQNQGDVIASNMGSGVNSVKDSQINVAKNGYSGGNYYKPTTYAPQYSSQQYQGDVIASNMGSGVNSVKDSQINVVKDGYGGGGGDFIASNYGSGVNSVEGSSINVMKQPYATTKAPQYSNKATINVIPNTYGTSRGDVIASNTGTGVNNVEDTDIMVVKDQYGGNVIASNTGSGTNSVQGSKISVMGGGQGYTARPVTVFEQMGTANINGHRVPVVKQEHGDIIASNMGSGVNNVKDSSILVVNDGSGSGPGDVIASNMGSGVNSVEGSSINVMKQQSSQKNDNKILAHFVSTHRPEYYQTSGDVIASNMGSGVNSVKDSEINVVKNGGGSGGDFIASNAGSGVNNVEGSNINVYKNSATNRPMYIEPVTVYENIGSINFAGHNIPVMIQEQGDIIASNLGSGVNNVKDSTINVVKNGYGGSGDFIASNAGSGVNNVEGSEINVMKGYASTYKPQQSYSQVQTQSERPKKGSLQVIPSSYGTARGDIIGSNSGSGVNNVEDSDILVVKDEQGGNVIASNTGSGTNNVQGSKISVMGGGQQPSYNTRPITIYEKMGTANVNGHRIPVVKQEHGDIIASNMGSGVNNVKDSTINVMKQNGGGGDFIASNAGSGVNNVEGSQINVMKARNTHAPQYQGYQGDVIASNMGSGVNSVKDSEINVVNNGGTGGGDFIASNAGSGVNSVQGSSINVMKNQGYNRAPTPFQHYVAKNTGSMPVQSYQQRGDVIASNTGSGVNNVQDSDIIVVNDQSGGGGGNVIASNTGSGTNSVQNSKISVLGGGYSSMPVTLYEPMGTASINGHRVPVMKQEHGDIIASNMGSGVNNVKDSSIVVMKDGSSGGDFIASNAGSGVNNVEGSSINVMKGSMYQQQQQIESDEACEDLQDADMFNVKDILKTLLFGESVHTQSSLNKVANILSKAQDLHRLRNILNTIHSKYNWNISDKELKREILSVLANPKSTDFSKFINGLYDYKLGGNGGANALFHLLGYTSSEAARHFDLNVVLNTIYSGRGPNIASSSGHLYKSGGTNIMNQRTGKSHTNSLKTDETNIFNHANSNGHLNTLNSGSTEILNQKTSRGHVNSLKNDDTNIFNQQHHHKGHLNTLNSGSTEIMNQRTTKGHMNSLKTQDTSIFNQVHPNGHFNSQKTAMVYNPEAPGCELFQYLKAKFPKINEKYIEKAVLATVSNFLNQNNLYNSVRVSRSVEAN